MDVAPRAEQNCFQMEEVIRYDLGRDSMKAEDMGDEELYGSCSRGDLGKSNKVTGF